MSSILNSRRWHVENVHPTFSGQPMRLNRSQYSSRFRFFPLNITKLFQMLQRSINQIGADIRLEHNIKNDSVVLFIVCDNFPRFC